jgi:hypothetical protein
LGNVSVQWVIGGKHSNIVSVDKGFMLEIGGPHADAKLFGLIGTGDYAAVIIGKHHHRSVIQVRAEEPFAGYIKVIAVYESECFFAVEFSHRFSQVISTENTMIIAEKYLTLSNNYSLLKFMWLPLHDVHNKADIFVTIFSRYEDQQADIQRE